MKNNFRDLANEMKTREHRMAEMIEMGYTADVENGIVYGLTNNQIGFINKGTGYRKLAIYKVGHTKGRTRENYYLIHEHHFIFYVAHGRVVKEIDHINGIKSDNRIENLREITHKENMIGGIRTRTTNVNSKKHYHYNAILDRWVGRTLEGEYYGIYDSKHLVKKAYKELLSKKENQ